MIDRFSHQMYEFLQAIQPNSTLQQFIDHFDPQFLGSTPVIRSDLFSRPASQVQLTEFFSGSFSHSKLQKYPLEGIKDYKLKAFGASEAKKTNSVDSPSFVLSMEATEPSSTVRILLLIFIGFITFKFLSQSKK